MQNTIERSITVHAPLDRVWDLVTEPGWWVPTDVPVPAGRTPGEVVERVSEKYGRFPVQVVELRPRTYAAFRWASAFVGEDLVDGRTTLVEFTLADSGGAVEVTVVESGFERIDAPDDVRRGNFESNTEGWALELDSLRSRCEA